MGARRRQLGFIAGALAPQSLKRPLGGRLGGQEGGGGRHRARARAQGRGLPFARRALTIAWPARIAGPGT